MLKTQQRKSLITGRTFRFFVVGVWTRRGLYARPDGRVWSSVFRAGGLFHRGGKLSWRCEPLSLKTQSHKQFEQKVGLIVLHTDVTAHLQRLFLQPNSGHRNEHDEQQSSGKAKEHRTPSIRLRQENCFAEQTPRMMESNRRQAGIVSNRVSSPMICVRPYWVYPGGSRAFAPLTLMSIVGATAKTPDAGRGRRKQRLLPLTHFEIHAVCPPSLTLSCHTLQKTQRFVGCDKFAQANAGSPLAEVIPPQIQSPKHRQRIIPAFDLFEVHHLDVIGSHAPKAPH